MPKKTEGLEDIQPGFWSVTPASVRYHEKLSMGAKHLYGEITALCNKQGYCWAKNEYFANLYKRDIRTIQRWVSSLEKQGFISTERGDKNYRFIYLTNIGSDKNVMVSMTKMSPYHDKNVVIPPSTLYKNNTINNTKNKEENFLKKISKRVGKTQSLEESIKDLLSLIKVEKN
jgi:DNA-binding MarR family transcriptional regulator